MSLVLVLVGTDHHPFDRLIQWTDEWLAQHQHTAGEPVRVIVQHGHTRPPVVAQGQAFMARQELDDLLAQADVVVCHGGPSTIVETRRRGLVPIVVARAAALGEHVDDHQQRFAKLMAGRGLIRVIDQQDDFAATVSAALRSPLLVSRDDVELPDPSQSALRLGRLIDELIARPERARLRGAAGSRTRPATGPSAH